jgi:hypothetical protein
MRAASKTGMRGGDPAGKMGMLRCSQIPRCVMALQ